jgi:hypothetical protein
MLRGCTREWKVALACLVLVCLLVTSTVVLGHDHGPSGNHSCDVCHLGQMAWTGTDVQRPFVPEVVEQWRHTAESKQDPQECVVSNASSRASPRLHEFPA